MRVAMHRRQEIIKTNYKTYQGAGKKKRGAILDRLVPTTGMNQDYLATTRGRYVPNESGTRTSRKKRAEGKRGGRPPVYRSAAFVKALTGIWDFFDYPCGKLLSPLIRGTLGFLEESTEIDLGMTPEIHPLLLRVSPAEINILLKPERKQREIRGNSLTQSDPVLKNSIPIRTFFKGDERKPGFFELDRVAHCGTTAQGQFCWTLTAVDVYSGWTEERALLNKAHFWTKAASADIRAALPFPMYGIDTDHGGEFINTQLLHWCDDNRILFIRGRPYRKNDNC